MICALYTVMRKYRDKKIYIWDANRDSMGVFTNAAFCRVDIKGFVVPQKEYAGQMYMNRPLVTIEQVVQEEDSIILVFDEVQKEKISMLPEERVVYWSDALEFDRELKDKKIIVYGIGHGVNQLCEVLAEEGLQPELYCVTKKEEGIEQYKGKKVIEAAELKQYEDYAVMISVLKNEYRSEILKTLSHFRNSVYIELEHIIGRLDMLNLIQSIDLAIRKDRKIFFYSQRNAVAEWMEEALAIYGVEISGYVYDVGNSEQGIQCIYELAFQGIQDKLIIINEDLPERLIRARENIELAGFSLEKKTYAGLQWYTHEKQFMLFEWKSHHDPLVGHSIIYPQGKPGWKVYGKEEENRIRILVLGGSTSSEIYHPENWISKLYYKLNQQNIKTTIYNGAHSGDDIVDEMLRLLRDANVLKPQIVINMSGVNNTDYKQSANDFNEIRFINWIQHLAPDEEYCGGVPSNETLYSFWNRNIRLLKLISEFYGAEYYGFLQPMNITMKNKNVWEKSLYEREVHRDADKDFAEYVNDESDYINLVHLFEQRDEMFLDVCHYTDKGHEAIANVVYDTIMPAIQIMEERKAKN